MKLDRPKIFIVGSSGYIGKRLFMQKMSNFDIYGTSSSGVEGTISLQLAQPSIFDYSIIEPSDFILLAAAISSPDVCANKYEYAWSVNVAGTAEFIIKSLACGARVVFFSSDTVYGENENGFDEQAECNPAGEYAKMKNEVEQIFVGNPLFKSIRLSYVFSHEDKFTKYLSGCAQRNEKAELFHPFFRAIIHRDDVVEGVLALAQRWEEFPQEVINFGGPEILSRVDFAECLKETGLPNLKYIVSKPGEDFFKNRPKIIAMKSEILPKLLRRPCRTLREAALIEFARH